MGWEYTRKLELDHPKLRNTKKTYPYVTTIPSHPWGCFFILSLTTNQVTKLTNQLTKPDLRNWQNRKEWFFKREHTDT